MASPPPNLARQRFIAGTFAIASLFGIAYVSISYDQRERTYEGIWLWQFEGSQFYEGAKVNNPCQLLAKRGSWLSYEPEQVLGSYDYRKSYFSSGTHVSQYGSFRLEAFTIRFVGTRSHHLLGTGHLGGWNTEYKVTRLVSAKPIPGLTCKVRYPD